LSENILSPTTEIASELLSLIAEQAKEEGGTDSKQFCDHIQEYRSLLAEAGTLQPRMAQDCIDECVTHFGRLRSASRVRVVEFNELIELLKQALMQLSTDNQAYHERIFESSDGFKRLGNLNDIREIKTQLMKLVRDLRQTVIDKQQQEERKNSEFSKRVRDLEGKLEVARKEALTDPLTGIANRAAFDRAINAWFDQKKAFVVGMMDIDHFKIINDTHGHDVGDSALQRAAQWLGQKLRQKDVLARFGGDEFAMLIEGITLTQAGKRFSDLVAEFGERSYTYSAGNQKRTVKFTMSCGLTEFTAGDSVATLMQRADQALYEAKRSRNRACTRARATSAGSY
jgi:diguanylate cyclase